MLTTPNAGAIIRALATSTDTSRRERSGPWRRWADGYWPGSSTKSGIWRSVAA